MAKMLRNNRSLQLSPAQSTAASLSPPRLLRRYDIFNFNLKKLSLPDLSLFPVPKNSVALNSPRLPLINNSSSKDIILPEIIKGANLSARKKEQDKKTSNKATYSKVEEEDAIT